MENTTINKKIKRRHETNIRIAIIGAGAAGLSAAEALGRKGYTHITLFEKADHAGGKCSTIDIEGKNYELGAGMIEENNKTVMHLVKKYNIDLKRVEFGKSVVVTGKDNRVRKKRSIKETVILFKQVFITYRSLHKKYVSLSKSGFSGIEHEKLAMPFAQFAKKYRCELLAAELELSHTGFGYGYFADVPAAYVLKYYSWHTLMAFVKRRMYFFPDGIAHLWTTIAKNFDVRYGVEIVDIARKNDTIFISVEGSNEPMIYDEMIVTSPLDELYTFLDITEDEQKLFSNIKHVDYRTIACKLSGFPKVTGYAPDNFCVSRAGHPVFWYHRHVDTDIYTFYVLAKDIHMSDDVVTQNVSHFVNSMNGTLEKVYTIRHWKYFPHVTSDIFKTGFYDKLEAIQGEQHTYYAGELMNFSTVGLTSQYADGLVQKFF